MPNLAAPPNSTAIPRTGLKDTLAPPSLPPSSRPVAKLLVILFLTTLALAIGWRLWSLSQEEQGKEKKGKPPVPVTLAKANTADLPVVLRLVGRAEAFERVELKPRVDGQVAGVDFSDGQHVAAGQVLVRLDPADFQARLRQAEANLKRDQAQLAKAAADLERYVALRAQGFVSEEKVEEMRTAKAAAEAVVKADQAEVDLARLQLDYTQIRAPFDGVVGERLVFPGSAVKENETPLAVVNRVRPLLVSFTVPERYLPRIRERLQAGPLPVSARIPGGAAHAYAGSARALDNAVDTATGTIRMKAELPNRDEALTPGQFLEVSLTLDTLLDAVTVPLEALQQGPEGAFVYVAKADQSAEQRPVRVAAEEAGRAALAEGLRAGETVITDGHSRLTPGAKIKAKDAKSGRERADDKGEP